MRQARNSHQQQQQQQSSLLLPPLSFGLLFFFGFLASFASSNVVVSAVDPGVVDGDAILSYPANFSIHRNRWLHRQQGGFNELQRPDAIDNESANSEKRKCTDVEPDHYFDQKLDHTNQSDERTFQQRYQVNLRYHNGSSSSSSQRPIVFLNIGGEGQIYYGDICDESRPIMRLAAAHGAIVVQLEHRFFGPNASSSSSGMGDLTAANLQRLLTLDQALDDIAAFVPFFNRHHGLNNLTKGNNGAVRWVAFGCSYAGSIAAWLRVKYAHLMAGSVAGSAPIWPKVDFWESSAVMEQAIQNTSAECAHMVRKTFDQQEKNITLLQLAFTRLENIIQNLGAAGLSRFCQSLVKEKGFLRKWLEPEDKEHIPADIGTSRLQIQDENTFYWTWMTCNEFGWFPTTDQEDSMFGDLISPKSSYEGCAKMFGSKYGARFVDSQVEKSRLRWGNGCTFEANNVVFTNGRLDPWSALSIGEECRGEALRKKSDAEWHLVSVWTPGASHCADWKPPYKGEPAGLAKTRQKVADEVNYYLESALLREQKKQENAS